jgi:hypothetical protein
MCRVYVGSVVSLEGQWRIYTAYPAGEQVVYTYLYFCKKKTRKTYLAEAKRPLQLTTGLPGPRGHTTAQVGEATRVHSPRVRLR